MSEQEPTPSEVETIPFNPENKAAGEKKIVIDGKEKVVHFTNNLWTQFAAYTRLIARSEEPRGGMDEAYKDELERVNAREIFEKFGQQYPNLYRKMEGINDQWEDITRQRQLEIEKAKAQFGENSPEADNLQNMFPYEPKLFAERDYYFSMAYDGLVPIAKNIDPNYDLSFFVA